MNAWAGALGRGAAGSYKMQRVCPGIEGRGASPLLAQLAEGKVQLVIYALPVLLILIFWLRLSVYVAV